MKKLVKLGVILWCHASVLSDNLVYALPANISFEKLISERRYIRKHLLLGKGKESLQIILSLRAALFTLKLDLAAVVCNEIILLFYPRTSSLLGDVIYDLQTQHDLP